MTSGSCYTFLGRTITWLAVELGPAVFIAVLGQLWLTLYPIGVFVIMSHGAHMPIMDIDFLALKSGMLT
jgi:hypothetical protein